MDEKETGRLEAFSDGVFAVAITLLVLNLHIPGASQSDGGLGFLLSQWPTFAAFVTSFATIGIMWINHHRLFTHIRHVNTPLMLLNLLLLMLIVFVPFPTALLAEYTVQPDQHFAAFLYCGTFIVLAICFNLLWRYASYKHRLLDKKADPEAIEAITRQYRFGPLFYLITFGLAWVYVPASIAANLLLALFFALPGRRPPRTEPGTQSEQGE